MLDALSNDAVVSVAPRRIKARRLRFARRAGRWLLLAGWIVLPLMPVLALGLSKLLGLEF
jgi:hypothetical protein